jgi:hypothetical protein
MGIERIAVKKGIEVLQKISDLDTPEIVEEGLYG